LSLYLTEKEEKEEDAEERRSKKKSYSSLKTREESGEKVIQESISKIKRGKTLARKERKG